MKFSSTQIEAEYRSPELDPDARALAQRFDAFVQGRGWAEVVITDVRRTRDDMQRIYLPIAKRIVESFRTGRYLSPNDKQMAPALHAMNELQLVEWARSKFSWHLVDSAIDFRNTDPSTGKPLYASPLSDDEREEIREEHRITLVSGLTREVAIEEWLRKQCPKDRWELILERHGTGPHWHVARRRFDRRARYLTAQHSNGVV